MSAPLNTYRVSICEWNLWEAVLEAATEDDAKMLAEQLMCTEGEAAFKHRDCGFDNVEAELVSSADDGDEGGVR